MKPFFYHSDILDICTENHLTADEIFSKLKKIHPKVWISTVYRNIEELVKNWKLKKIHNIGKKALFEKNKWFHIHLIDEKTWKIIDKDCKNLNLNLPEWFQAKDIEITVKWEFIK